jgi:hypothetical protein
VQLLYNNGIAILNSAFVTQIYIHSRQRYFLVDNKVFNNILDSSRKTHTSPITMIVTLAVRVLSLLFAAVVLALSAVLIKDFGPGKGPALIGYGAFCGGAGIVIGAIGVIACFFDKLQGIIMLGLDAFASFFLLAGGIVRSPLPFLT